MVRTADRWKADKIKKISISGRNKIEGKME